MTDDNRHARFEHARRALRGNTSYLGYPMLAIRAAEQDEKARLAEAAGEVLAAKLRVEGGECDCGEYGLFTVKLTDGRVYTHTAIHGSGGVWRLSSREDFPVLLKRVLMFVERKRADTEFRDVVIYLANRYWGGITMSVPPELIESIS